MALQERTFYLGLTGVGIAVVIVVMLAVLGMFNRDDASTPEVTSSSVNTQIADTEEKQRLLDSIDSPAGPKQYTFDSENSAEYATLLNVGSSDADQNELVEDARETTQFFVERFGTYTSDTSRTYARDLQGFMTDRMWNSVAQYVDTDIAGRSNDFSIETQVLSTDVVDVSLPNRRAEISVRAYRTEIFSSETDAYNQSAVVVLRQGNDGSWLVDSIAWNSRS